MIDAMIENFNDMFGSDDKREQKRSKEAQELLKKKFDKVCEAASICLKDKNFEEYRKYFEKAKENLIDFMLIYRDPENDPTKYGAQMMVYTDRLKTLKSFISQVESHAKKGKVNGEI